MNWPMLIREQLLPSMIAIVLVLVYAALILQGKLVSDGLEVLVTAVVTFYYGSQVVTSARRLAESASIEREAKLTNGGTGNGGTAHS